MQSQNLESVSLIVLISLVCTKVCDMGTEALGVLGGVFLKFIPGSLMQIGTVLKTYLISGKCGVVHVAWNAFVSFYWCGIVCVLLVTCKMWAVCLHWSVHHFGIDSVWSEFVLHRLPSLSSERWHVPVCVGILWNSRWWARILFNPFKGDVETPTTENHCADGLNLYLLTWVWASVVCYFLIELRCLWRLFHKMLVNRRLKTYPVKASVTQPKCIRFYGLYSLSALYDDSLEGRRVRSVIFAIQSDFPTYLRFVLAQAKELNLGINSIASVACHTLHALSLRFPPGGIFAVEILIQTTLLDINRVNKGKLFPLAILWTGVHSQLEIQLGFALAYFAMVHIDAEIAHTIAISLGESIQEGGNKGKNKHGGRASSYGGSLSPAERWIRRKLQTENREYYELLKWSGLEGVDYRDAVEMSDDYLSWREAVKDAPLFAMEDGMGFTEDDFFYRFLAEQASRHSGNKKGNDANRLMETVKVTSMAYRQAGRRCRFGGYAAGLADYQDDDYFRGDINDPYTGQWADDTEQLAAATSLRVRLPRHMSRPEGVERLESPLQPIKPVVPAVPANGTGFATPAISSSFRDLISSVPVHIRNDVNVVEAMVALDDKGHSVVVSEGDPYAHMKATLRQAFVMNQSLRTEVSRRKDIKVEQEGVGGEEEELQDCVSTVASSQSAKRKRKPKKKKNKAQAPVVEEVLQTQQESYVPGTRPVSIDLLPVCAVFSKSGGTYSFHGQGVVVVDGGSKSIFTNAHGLDRAFSELVAVLRTGQTYRINRDKVKIVCASSDILVLPIGDVDVPVADFHPDGRVPQGTALFILFFEPAPKADPEDPFKGKWDIQFGSAGSSGLKANDAGQEIPFTQFRASTRSGICRAGVFMHDGHYVGGHHWSSVDTESGRFPAFDNDAATNGVRSNRKQAPLKKLWDVGPFQQAPTKGELKKYRFGPVGTVGEHITGHPDPNPKRGLYGRRTPTIGVTSAHIDSDFRETSPFFDHSSYDHRGASVPYNECVRLKAEWNTRILTPVQNKDRIWDFIPSVTFGELNEAGVGLKHWHVKPGIEAVHAEIQKFRDHKIDARFVHTFCETMKHMAKRRLDNLGGPYVPIDPNEDPVGARAKMVVVFDELNKSSKTGATDVNRTTHAFTSHIGGGDFEKGKELVIDFSVTLTKYLYDMEGKTTQDHIEIIDFPAVVFAKADKYEVRKLQKNGGRSIQAVDLFYKMLWGYFFLEHDFDWNTMNTEFARKNTYDRNPDATSYDRFRLPEDGNFVGINANNGLPLWRKNLMIGKRMVWSTDITGFDRDMPSVLIKSYFEYYLKPLVYLPLTALYTFFFSSVQTTMVMPDGTVYRKFSGNLSGKNDTLMMNCVINTACSAIALAGAKKYVKRGIKFEAPIVDGDPSGDQFGHEGYTPGQPEVRCHHLRTNADGTRTLAAYAWRTDYYSKMEDKFDDFNPFDVFHGTCSHPHCSRKEEQLDFSTMDRVGFIHTTQNWHTDDRKVACQCTYDGFFPAMTDVTSVLGTDFCEIVGDDNRTFLGLSGLIYPHCIEATTRMARAQGIRDVDYNPLVKEVFRWYLKFWEYFLPWEIKVEGTWLPKPGKTLQEADLKDVPPFCGRRLVSAGPTVFMPLAEVNRTMVHVLTQANGDSEDLKQQRVLGVAWALVPNILLHHMGKLFDPCIEYLIVKDGQFSPDLAAERFCDSLIMELLTLSHQESACDQDLLLADFQAAGWQE